MSQETVSSPPASRPTPIILAAVSFFYITVILRTLAEAEALATWLGFYLALECLFGVLFALTLWRPIRRLTLRHLYFIFQSLLALLLLDLHPRLDFTNILLLLLSFQAALAFSGRVRWFWVTLLILCIVLSLTILLGAYGLALSLLPAAGAIVFPAYVIVTQEIEAVQYKQQALLSELQQANQQLTAYAGQVEELAGIQERSRLARELHDSVSQTLFSIGLHSRAARILLERDAEQLQPQLQQLQTLTHSALEEMRSLITDLRPRKHTADSGPTS